MSRKADPRASEIVNALVDGGFPVSSVAEIARVPNTVVYQWKRGEAGLRPDGLARLETLLPVMSASSGGAFKALFRIRSFKDADGRSIRDLMSAHPLDVAAVEAALSHNARQVERYARLDADARPTPGGAHSRGRNGFLDDLPEAGID